MKPRIETSVSRKLVGQKIVMSLAGNRTRELWQNFQSQKDSIPNQVGSDRYGLQVYPADYFMRFNPTATFEKWAAVEVNDYAGMPHSMERFELSGGLHAVFLHKGAALTAGPTYQYIYGTWLPQSEFLLDHRPHFEVLGSKYRNDDLSSEEEIWIPIKPK